MSYGITLKNPPCFKDIPQFTRAAAYGVDVSWRYLKHHIDNHNEPDGIDLDPDFQRGHVWTSEKREAYIEFCLRGGTSSRVIQFNCPDFNLGGRKDYVLVDGKQRLTTILMFLDDQVPVFGGYVYSEFKDGLRWAKESTSVRWNVNDLATRAEVLQWYLDLNTGGVVHTSDEINKVKRMLQEELAASRK